MCRKAFNELTNKELQEIKEKRIEIETYYCTKVLKNNLVKMRERFEKTCKDYQLFSDPYEKFCCKIEAETIKELILNQVNLEIKQELGKLN